MEGKDQIDDDRPEISLSTLDKAEENAKTSKESLLGQVSALGDGKDPADPLAVQRSLKTGFLITLAIGSVCIYLFRNTGVWNIGLCLGVMLLYWWFANSRIGSVTAKSVFADSFYYLGFLFTFVALIVTMIGLDTETGNFSAKAIIGQIGPALATTVVGMAVRIYITQFDAITSEPEAEVFSGLGELSSNLSSAISELQKMIKDHVATTEKQQKSNSELTQKFSAQIEKLDFNPAVAALRTFGSELSKLGTQVDLLTKATGQTESGVADLTNSMYRTTTELNKAYKEFSRYEEIGKDYDETRETLVQVAEGALAIKNVIDETADIDILKAVTDLDAKASSIDQKLEKSDAQIERLGASANDARETLDSSLGKLKEASKAVTDITEQMSQLKGLSADLLETKSAVLALRKEVQTINEQITKEIEKARRELGKTTDLTAAILKEEVAPISTAISKVAEGFSPIEKNLKDLDIQVRKSVSDVLDFLNK